MPICPPIRANWRPYIATSFTPGKKIEFNRLITITNMPTSRYLDYLVQSGQLESYMHTLVDRFNPRAVDGLRCRDMLSVGWDGRLFDCDFNQMLETDLLQGSPSTIHDFHYQLLANRKIAVGHHCYGCTAGAGSGCQGAIAW
jgi:radical SAM/Cys-rich protein